MAGADGNVVGSIKIRVKPDLTKFREELQSKLEAIERALNQDIEVGVDEKHLEKSLDDAVDNATKKSGKRKVKVDVDPKVDMDRFQKRLLSDLNSAFSKIEPNLKLDDIGEETRRMFEKTEAKIRDRIKLKIPVDIAEAAEWRREVDDLVKEAQDIAKNSVKLELDSGFTRKLAQRVESLKPKVNLELDPGFTRKLTEKVKSVNLKSRLDLQPVVLAERFDLGGLQGELNRQVREFELFEARAKASLDRVSETPVNIKVRFDRDTFERGLSSTIDGTVQTFKKLGNVLGNLGIRGENLGVIAAALVLLSPALAVVSGALVTLPAAFAALTVPIGTIALGLDGVKKAAEQAKPAFDNLRNAVSGVFETELGPGFQTLNNQILPQLQDSFKNVASGLSDAFKGVTDVFASEQGLGNLKTIISSVGDAIRDATPGLQDFTSGLLELTGRLAEKFPGLAEAFNRTGASFLEWVDAFTTKDPVTQVSQLDSAMKALGDTLSPIGGLITDLFKDGINNLSDGGYAQSLESFVESARELITDTLPALSAGFQSLAGVLEPIAATVGIISDALDFVLPDIPDYTGNSIPDWLPIIGSWDGLAGLFEGSEALGIAEGAKLGQAVKQGAESIISAGLEIGTEGLIPTDIGQAVSQQIKQSIQVSAEDQKQALLSAFTPDAVGAAVSQQLQTQVTAAVAGARQALQQLGPQLQADIDAATLPLAGMADKIGTVIGTAFQGVQQTVTASFAFLTLAVGAQAGNVATAVQQAFSTVPQRIGQVFTGVPAAIRAGMAGSTAVVQEVMGQVAQAAAAGGAKTAEATAAAFSAVPPAIQGAMAPAITTVADICQQMVSTALSFAGAMEASGRSIGASFAAGLASSVGLVQASASALLTAARAFFPNSPAKTGPFSGAGWVDKSGEAVGAGFASGLEGSAGQVVEVARVLMQQVKDVFGNAQGVVFNFNFGGAAQSMGDLATATKDFSTNLSQTAATTGGLDQLTTATQQEIDALKVKKSELDLLRQQLQAEKNAAGDKGTKAVIQQRIDELNVQKAQLQTQIQQYEYAAKYNDQVGQVNQEYQDIAKRGFQDLPMNFGKAVSGQFMNDLGMSGSGAIPTLLDQGVSYVFQVMNMDQAMSAQQTLQNKQTQTYSRR